MELKTFLLILASILIASCGQLLLKQGMLYIGPLNLEASLLSALPKLLLNLWLIGGLLCYGLSAVLWLIVLSKTELSYAYPMVSFSYVFVVFMSAILFKEPVTALRWIAIFVICLGVYLLSKS